MDHKRHDDLQCRAAAGVRWGLDGAEAILKLRALTASGDFEPYWHYHLRREHERIHSARYRESLILAA